MPGSWGKTKVINSLWSPAETHCITNVDEPLEKKQQVAHTELNPCKICMGLKKPMQSTKSQWLHAGSMNKRSMLSFHSRTQISIQTQHKEHSTNFSEALIDSNVHFHYWKKSQLWLPDTVLRQNHVSMVNSDTANTVIIVSLLDRNKWSLSRGP